MDAMNELDDFIKTMKSGSLRISEEKTAIWIQATPIELFDACEACIGSGGVFDSAFIYPSVGGRDWTAAYIFLVPRLAKIAIVWSHAKRFFSISGRIPAALWDERKMHELSGAEFFGLQDTRPLVLHPESVNLLKHQVRSRLTNSQRDSYTYAYHFEGTGAEGEFEIPVGPVHAGIIEPGHFRFHVVGEEINRLEVRLSYLHRGIEKIVRGKRLDAVLPVIEQISGDESAANSIAYAQAVESLAEITVPKKAESLRLIIAELERIYSHLADIGGMAMDVGFYASSYRFAALRESALRLNEQIFGNRFLRGIVSIGGIGRDIPNGSLAELQRSLKAFLRELEDIENMTVSSSTFLDRAFTTGIVRKESAKELALVGPAARASGLNCDIRKHLPYGAYKSNKIIEHTAENGDVLSRFMVKFNEIRESVRLINVELSRKAWSRGPRAARYSLQSVRSGSIGIGICEAARGGSTFLIRAGKNGTVDVLSVRTSSFRNWRALERAVITNIIGDFPLINKSFNLSYSGADL